MKRKEILNKKLFDRKSFRTITLSPQKKIKGIIGCRKGFYDKKNKKCVIGTELQAILYPNTIENPVDEHFNYKDMIKNLTIKKGQFVGNADELIYDYMTKKYKHKFQSKPAIYGGKGYVVLIDKNLWTNKHGIHN